MRKFFLSLGPTSYRDLRYQVHFNDGLDNTLVLDGVPIINKSKLDKLVAKITKEFSRKGAPIKINDVFVPWDNSKDESKGCVSKILRHETMD